MDLDNEELLHFAQSPFQKISVHQADRIRLLRTGNTTIQSAMDLDAPHKLLVPYMPPMMAWLLFRPPCQSALMLGLGGGDILRYLRHYLPAGNVTAVEEDEVIIEFCQDYFKLPRAKQIELICDDALRYVAVGRNTFDVVFVDLFRDGLESDLENNPALLSQCHRRLNDDGVLVLNVVTEDAEYFKNMLADLRGLFDRNTLCLTVPGYKNIITFAFKKRPSTVSRDDLLEKSTQISTAFELDFDAMVENLFITNPSENDRLLF